MIGSSRRPGLSLLEVILAFAILAGSLAVLGELIRQGARAAAESRDLTRGQLLCESKISEVAAGVAPADPVQRVPFENDPEWLYSIEVLETEQPGLLGIHVTVEPNLDDLTQRHVSFTLVRWIPDPSLGLSEEQPLTTNSVPSGASSGNSSSDDAGGSGGSNP